MYSASGFAGRGGMGGGRGGGMGGGNNFTQGGGNFGQQPGGSSPGGAAKRQVQPIRPMTIKQLINAQRVGDGVMIVDGKETSQASVLGRVVEHEGNAANAATAKHHGYKISDGSGIMVVRQWLDADKSQELLPVGSYVRSSGTVKVWQDKPVITGTVRLVSDCNEFTFHMLEVVLTHQRITRGPVPRVAAAPRPVQVETAPYGAPVQAGEKLYPSDIVASILKNHARTDASGGLTKEEVAAQAQRYGITIGDVLKAMKELVQEGKVFTVDQHRYSYA